MKVIHKEYITRPSLDSIFVFEFEQIINERIMSWTDCHDNSTILSVGPPIYLEFITWREVIARKEEIRPDLKYYLDQQGLFNESIYLNLDDGPTFNYFSLTFTQVTEFDSIENFKHTHKSLENILSNRNKNLEVCSNTRNEELWIDGQLVSLKDL